MCGKFTQMYSWREVVDFSQPLDAHADDRPSPDDDGGNDSEETVTPMRSASVLHLKAEGFRGVTQMRWGWSKSISVVRYERPDYIHARAETIDARPTFRDAFRQRRSILVVRTFNEGAELPNGKTKQHVITPNDGRPVGIAAIWNLESRDDGPFYSFVMATVGANKLISTITDRMPAVLQHDDWPKWLGEEPGSAEEVKALLRPIEGDWTMRPQEKSPKTQRPMGLFQ
jgi:putative SOS response-associated peptidase YedK